MMLMIMFGGNAYAEPRRLAVILECDTDLADILNMVQLKYYEKPFAQGKMLLQVMMPNGVTQWQEADMLMLVNPTAPDRSFSVIAGFPNGHGCVLVPGKEFSPSFGKGVTQ